MSKPFAGYPSRSAAVAAFVEQGIARREIAHRLGVTTSVVAGLISSAKRKDRCPDGRRSDPMGNATAGEMSIMDLWDSGMGSFAIADALGLTDKYVRRVLSNMREQAGDVHDPKAIASSTDALGKALERSCADRAADEPTRRLSFQEQLAFVASGRARLVPTISMRRPDYDGTLGGVGSGWL